MKNCIKNESRLGIPIGLSLRTRDHEPGVIPWKLPNHASINETNG